MDSPRIGDCGKILKLRPAKKIGAFTVYSDLLAGALDQRVNEALPKNDVSKVHGLLRV